MQHKKEKAKRGATLTGIITLKADEGTIKKLHDLAADFVAEKATQGENVNGGHAQVIRKLIHLAHGARVAPGGEGSPRGRG